MHWESQAKSGVWKKGLKNIAFLFLVRKEYKFFKNLKENQTYSLQGIAFDCLRIEQIIAPLFVYVGPPPIGSKLLQRTQLSDGVGC